MGKGWIVAALISIAGPAVASECGPNVPEDLCVRLQDQKERRENLMEMNPDLDWVDEFREKLMIEGAREKLSELIHD